MMSVDLGAIAPSDDDITHCSSSNPRHSAHFATTTNVTLTHADTLEHLAT